MNMERNTIKVIGRSVRKVMPDTINLKFIIENKDTKLKNVTDKANDDFIKIEHALLTVGLQKEDIKTSNIEVQSKNGAIFDKVNFTQNFSVEFPLDNELVSDVINAISKTGSKPSYEFSFTLKDKETINDELISEACKNAIDKANVIARSTNISVGNILHISFDNYSNSRMLYMDYMEMDTSFSDNTKAKVPTLNPEPIEMSNEVTIIWEIL